MDKLKQLLRYREELMELKEKLDEDAPFNTESGYYYARTLLRLVLSTMEIEVLQKEKANHCNG